MCSPGRLTGLLIAMYILPCSGASDERAADRQTRGRPGRHRAPLAGPRGVSVGRRDRRAARPAEVDDPRARDGDQAQGRAGPRRGAEPLMAAHVGRLGRGGAADPHRGSGRRRGPAARPGEHRRVAHRLRRARGADRLRAPRPRRLHDGRRDPRRRPRDRSPAARRRRWRHRPRAGWRSDRHHEPGRQWPAVRASRRPR